MYFDIEGRFGEKNVIQVVTDNRSNYVLAAVLSNGGNGGAMAVLHGESLKKRHRIAVAWRVYNGGRYSHGGHGGIAEIAGFFVFFFLRGRSWADPTQPYSLCYSKVQRGNAAQNAARDQERHPAPSSHRALSSDDPVARTHDPAATSTGR